MGIMAPVARGYARYVLVVMVGITFLNYMDRYVGAAASPLIQKEFHLSDSEVGLLGSAFLLVYAVAAVPFGYWADRGVRKTVVAAGGAVWSPAPLFTRFPRSLTPPLVHPAPLWFVARGTLPPLPLLPYGFFP